MFGFIKKVIFTRLTLLSRVNPLNEIPLSAVPLNATLFKCVSMTNQKCKVRLQIVNVNSDKPVFYPYSIKTSKCSGSCNNINDALDLFQEDSNQNNFHYKLLLNNTQGLRLRKAFANNSSANIKLSKTQLHKKGQSRGLLRRLLGPLLKNGLPLIGNVLQTLAKSVLIPLGLTSVASATDATIHKKIFESGTRPSDLAQQTT